mmetsp:Transcript_42849/g.67168  ORF Transcript_42849/g.67168 Transcript_42849/m.67168 type:complete len:259 (+) Transcript_42849:949-1725(+)
MTADWQRPRCSGMQEGTRDGRMEGLPSPDCRAASTSEECRDSCDSQEKTTQVSRIIMDQSGRLGRIVKVIEGVSRRRPAAAGAGLLVGSFCCAAAATKMRLDPGWGPELLRAGLALFGLCGFITFFGRHVAQRTWKLRWIVATAAATALSTAAATWAAAIAVVTAATMYLRTAVRRGLEGEHRRWIYTLMGVGTDLLELGALLLQMILMTQWVFGEFSVMPVMATTSMMFALIHSVHNYAEVLHLTDANEPVSLLHFS